MLSLYSYFTTTCVCYFYYLKFPEVDIPSVYVLTDIATTNLVVVLTARLFYGAYSLVIRDILFLFYILHSAQHGDGFPAMARSREAARKAEPWREAINNIAPLAISFSNTIVRPTSFSNWK